MENKNKKFFELELIEIIEAINEIDASPLFIINEKVMIPEADVLLCSYRNKRINIKVDLQPAAQSLPSVL
jgi:hypothetical protein